MTSTFGSAASWAVGTVRVFHATQPVLDTPNATVNPLNTNRRISRPLAKWLGPSPRASGPSRAGPSGPTTRLAAVLTGRGTVIHRETVRPPSATIRAPRRFDLRPRA